MITIFSGSSFVTKKKVVDLGPLEIKKSKKHTFPMAPVVGIAVFIFGSGMFLIGYTKKTPPDETPLPIRKKSSLNAEKACF